MIDKILQSPLNEIIQGFHYDDVQKEYTCLICNAIFKSVESTPWTMNYSKLLWLLKCI